MRIAICRFSRLRDNLQTVGGIQVAQFQRFGDCDLDRSGNPSRAVDG
jgi:hypothetical protein